MVVPDAMVVPDVPRCRLHPALRAGLERDLSAWPLHSITQHSMDAGADAVKRGESDITAALAIYNNSLYFLRPHHFKPPRNPHIYAIADDLRALAQLHPLPDVEFVLNVDDYPKADRRVPAVPGGPPKIPQPLFSYCKREEGGSSGDYDVLIPSGAFRMALYERKLLSKSVDEWEASHPWQSKKAKAYFRGTPYCGIHNFGRCSRYVLARLAHENRSTQLDVGLIEYNAAHDTEMQRARNRGQPLRSGALRRAAYRDESAYAQHKYLLHLDGHSFSNRLQSLLLSNSAVLKQDSRYTEYYYRALAAWTHYVPFYREAPDDILPLLANLSAHDAAVRGVAKAGQAFAHAHLHVDARMCYWRHLLHGWRRRLAYAPSLAARPQARRIRTRDYVCGECRRGSNPELIGPWPPGHACARPRERGYYASGDRAPGPGVAPTVRRCRLTQMRDGQLAATTAARGRASSRARLG